MQETLRDRVSALVRAQYPEGAKHAAAAMEIPQPTLHLIIAGTSENPRAQTLQRIAEHFGTTVEWLLTGAGPLPAILGEERPLTALTSAIERVRLDEDSAMVWYGLTTWLSSLRRTLYTRRRIGDSPEPTTVLAAHQKWREAEAAFDALLAAELDALVLEFGAERARKHLADPVVQEELQRLAQLADPDVVATLKQVKGNPLLPPTSPDSAWTYPSPKRPLRAPARKARPTATHRAVPKGKRRPARKRKR
jgi:hypothetical protein